SRFQRGSSLRKNEAVDSNCCSACNPMPLLHPWTYSTSSPKRSKSGGGHGSDLGSLRDAGWCSLCACGACNRRDGKICQMIATSSSIFVKAFFSESEVLRIS